MGSATVHRVDVGPVAGVGRLLNMFGGQEWIIIVIVAVVLFGGSQIPKLARSLGQAQKEFKTGLSEGKSEDDDTADETTESKKK